MIYLITGAFILLDFITGIIKGFVSKQFSSSIMRQGLFHKAGSILVVVFGALVDYSQGYIDLGIKIPVASTMCLYIVLMEIGSIIENVCVINPRIIPNKLQSYFQKLSENTKSEKKEVEKVDDVQSKKG